MPDSLPLLIAETAKLIDATCPVIERLSGGEAYPADSLASLFYRAAASKTFAAMRAVLDLVRGGHAFAAQTLLRPMVEELILVRYLNTLALTDVEAYVYNQAVVEIVDGIEMQHRFWLRHSDVQAPFSDVSSFGEVKRARSGALARLRALGERLGWGKGHSSLSVKQMAKATDSLELYNFFYHATSRSVHASMHHLLRMVGFRPGQRDAYISTQNFADYYAAFSLIYGAWLFGLLLDDLAERFPDMWSADERMKIGMWLGSVAQRDWPLIVTAEETLM